MSARLAVVFGSAFVAVAHGHAQVATNLDALEAIKPQTPEARSEKKPAVTRRDAPSPTRPHKQEDAKSPAAPAAAHDTRETMPHKQVAPAAPPSQRQAQRMVGPPPDVPPAPPRNVVIAPPAVVVQTHPPVAPAPVVPDPKARTKASRIPNGLKIVYKPLETSLGAASLQKLEKFAQGLARAPQLRVTIRSWASGQADDPSVPRRIALTRALVVRSVLINNGVATTRIYPRAEGLPTGEIKPADTLELKAEGAAPAPPSEAYYPMSTGNKPR